LGVNFVFYMGNIKISPKVYFKSSIKYDLEVFKPGPAQKVQFNKIWEEIAKKGLENITLEFLNSINEIKTVDSTYDFISQAEFLLELSKFISM
jgi:hypothetical protein